MARGPRLVCSVSQRGVFVSQSGSIGGQTVVHEGYAERLIDTVTDTAFILLDADGAVSSWSHGAELIHRRSADELIGRSAYIHNQT